MGSKRRDGARLPRFQVVRHSDGLSRDGPLHPRRIAARSAGDEHLWRSRRLQDRGCRGVHAAGTHAAAAAVHDAAEAVLFRLQGSIERRGNL